MNLELLLLCFISWATGTPSQDVSLRTHSLYGPPFSFLFLLHPLSPSRWPCLLPHFPSFYGPDAAFFTILPGEAAWLLYFRFCLHSRAGIYTLWRICHVIPSESLSQRSPWSHWTPRAKVRPHQLKSLKTSCSAVMGSFLSCADIFPISVSHISVLRSQEQHTLRSHY